MDVSKLAGPPDRPPNPFSALIAVSSLLAALLYVAGFAYRWSYYYNFGAQHIVSKLGFQSFLIAAFELVRTPAGLAAVLAVVVVPVLLLSRLLAALARGFASESPRTQRRVRPFRWLGLDVPLVVDLLRASVMVFATYAVAASIGYRTFLHHLSDAPDNPLPAVTAVLGGGQKSSVALACGAVATGDAAPAFIGDGARLRDLATFNRTCARGGTVTWRLLYVDDDEIDLFATEPQAGRDGRPPDRRPLTLMLPNRGDVSLVME